MVSGAIATAWLIGWYGVALIVGPIVWACLSDEVREAKDGVPGVRVALGMALAPFWPLVLAVLFYVWIFAKCGGKLRPNPKPARPPGLSDDEWLAKMRRDVADFEAQCLAAAGSEGE